MIGTEMDDRMIGNRMIGIDVAPTTGSMRLKMLKPLLPLKKKHLIARMFPRHLLLRNLTNPLPPFQVLAMQLITWAMKIQGMTNPLLVLTTRLMIQFVLSLPVCFIFQNLSQSKMLRMEMKIMTKL